MIDSLLRKPVEAPAPKRTEPALSKKSAAKDLDSSLEATEFKSELESASSEDHTPETKVKAVKVSKEQKLEKPSKLINPDAVEPDLVDPKMFDPTMTKDVQKLINPETVEVPVEGTEVQVQDQALAQLLKQDPKPLKGISAEAKVLDPKAMQMMEEVSVGGPVVEGEILPQDTQLQQALLKSPQVAQAGGRSPAIDFAQSEIDPQLLNMEDFVAQKNSAVKKNVQSNAYGMKTQTPANKMALENGLKANQVVTELPQAETSSGGAMNSQQFILNMQKEQSGSPKTNDAQAPKVFDMGTMKSSNADQIMTQITDYIVQAKASKEPTVTMRVNHEELGMIDITVSKMTQLSSDGGVAINIGTHSADGKNFFQQNAKDLFSHLANSGINVTDFKIETPSQSAKNEFDMNHGGRQGQGSEKQFGSEQGQRRHDSDRRQDLWKLLNEEAA